MEIIFRDNSGNTTREDYEDTPLAAGGQGAAYRSRNNAHVAKLYDFSQGTPQALIDEQARQVDEIIGHYNVVGNDPYWNELFSWPDRRAVAPQLGVRMRFVSSLTRMDHYFYRAAFEKLTDTQRGWWIGRVACAIKLARAVRRMADFGLCHSDLSDKNVMVDPFSGRLTVIDCDSLVVPGAAAMKHRVLGTAGYMAPEIVSGQAQSPSVETDRHALAVLLYRWLLLNRHPLDGRLVHAPDPADDDRLRYGERALYVEHPIDTRNRPANPMQLTASTLEQEIAPGQTVRTVSSLTPRLAKLFEDSFVRYLHVPAKRPLPITWEEALLELYDQVIPCSNPRCALKYFAASDTEALKCPLCGSWAGIPGEIPLLRLKKPQPDGTGSWDLRDEDVFGHFIAGWQGRPLYRWHAYQSVPAVPDPMAGPPDTEPVALIHYDDRTEEWQLVNRRLPELWMEVGDDPDAPQWQRLPPGDPITLRDDLQLLLGSPKGGRGIEVEMRQVYKTDE